jgi:hypothetical protein
VSILVFQMLFAGNIGQPSSEGGAPTGAAPGDALLAGGSGDIAPSQPAISAVNSMVGSLVPVVVRRAILNPPIRIICTPVPR